MRVSHLWLRDFRCYEQVEVEFPPGTTVIEGGNGEGKTSLLEAVGWVATASSFRGVPDSALVRAGREHAVLRAEVADDERTQILEAELRVAGRNRLLLNHQPVTRSRELAGLLRVTVFAPDDLQLIKGAPSERRRYLDDLLVAITPRFEAVRGDLERVLRQRNALLRGGVHTPGERDTLSVFDEQLVRAGGELVRGRLQLAARLVPAVDDAVRGLAGDASPRIRARYEASWSAGHDLLPETVDGLLRAALAGARRKEVERGITLVGPHRDDWRLSLGDLDSRTHASQGEQRTLALALRLAGHRVCTEVLDSSPVLLLDDVFSELDEDRRHALVVNLPSCQALLTTAGTPPPGIAADLSLRVGSGRAEAA